MSLLGGKSIPTFDWARVLRRLPGLVCVTEPDGRIVTISGRLFDEDPDVLVITHIWQLVVKGQRAKLREAISATLAENRSQQIWVESRRIEGSTYVVELAPADQHVVLVWVGASEILDFDEEPGDLEALDPELEETPGPPDRPDEPSYLIELTSTPDDPWNAARLAETEAGAPRRPDLFIGGYEPVAPAADAARAEDDEQPEATDEVPVTSTPLTPADERAARVREMDELFPRPQSPDPERRSGGAGLSFTPPVDQGSPAAPAPVTASPPRRDAPDYVIVAPQSLRRLAGRLQRAFDLATPHTVVWFEEEFDSKVSRLGPTSRVVFLGPSRYADFMRRVVKARYDKAGACWGVLERKALIWTHEEGEEREVAKGIDAAMSRAGKVSLSRSVGAHAGEEPPSGRELAGKFLMEPSPRRPDFDEEKYILGVSMFLLDGFEDFHKSVTG